MNKFIPTFLIVCASAGVGMLLTRGMQVQLNKQAKQECKVTHHRTLIHVTTVVGDAYYCAPLAAFGK
ncbi:MAG: hypothetical protein DWQ49_12780 [Bacteroidetes bacterium]|jgi:hypothetical protein|nr:MAG: hypothetical protein DWQ49_12780 [Bacteroidota bacterium]